MRVILNDGPLCGKQLEASGAAEIHVPYVPPYLATIPVWPWSIAAPAWPVYFALVYRRTSRRTLEGLPTYDFAGFPTWDLAPPGPAR